LWGMLNTLQLIDSILKFSVDVPDNVFVFFDVITTFLNMKA